LQPRFDDVTWHHADRGGRALSRCHASSRCHPNRQGGGGRGTRGPVRDAEGCDGPRIGV
jgi:hypothetical protein